MLLGRVSPPNWDKETVYCLGGGPSLKGFDFGTLEGRKVVAVNNAVYSYSASSAVISVDCTWIERNTSLLPLSFNGEIVLGVPEGDDTLCKDYQKFPEITWINWKQKPGLSLNPFVLHSPCTSGYAAVNYAVLKGAKRIILLGYDYCRAGEHWFKPYEWESGADEDIYALWAKQYNSMVPVLEQLGVIVWNSNPNSQITAFPSIELL
jgi:hypothetical protein